MVLCMSDHTLGALPLTSADEGELLPPRRRRWMARTNLGLYVSGAILAVVVVCMV